MHISEDYSRPQRVALLVWWLAHGELLTDAQTAEVLRLPVAEARGVLVAVSCVVPVAADVDGWYRMHGRKPVEPPTDTVERAAVLAWYLACGTPLTRTSAGALVGLDGEHAARLLDRLTNVLPIYLDGGRWQVCAGDEDYEPLFVLADGRCFHCGGVDSLRTGIIWRNGEQVGIWWCSRCERLYRQLARGK